MIDAASLRPAHARFRGVAADAGHYESFYVKACAPGGGRGVWIRHTVHKRPGASPRGSLWCTFFDRAAEGPRAAKVTLDDVEALPGGGLRTGDARFTPDALSGAARTEHCDAEWDLRVEGGEAPMAHLPAGWMYRARIPRTKVVTLRPAARLSGRLVVDGEEIALDGWPGLMNHNWGTEHAERWIWLHGEADGVWVDAAIGRIRLGPWTTPWVANGAISVDGRRHPLGGPGRVRSTRVEEQPTRCGFQLPGDGVVVRGEVSAPAKDFVAWEYADPDGPPHNTVNCSVADLIMSVEPADGGAPREVRVAAAAAYELGMRETDHGIPLQPFGDG